MGNYSFKICPECGGQMLLLPKCACEKGACSLVTYIWICMKCGKEISQGDLNEKEKGKEK